jgi:hypothetical protein
MSWIATGAAALSVVGGISAKKTDEKKSRIGAAQESLGQEQATQDIVQGGKQAGRGMILGAEESKIARGRARAQETTLSDEGTRAANLVSSMRDTMAPVGRRTGQFNAVLGAPGAAPGGMFRAGTAGNTFADAMRTRAGAAGGFNRELAGTYGALTAAGDQAISEGAGVADAMRTVQRGAASRGAIDADTQSALRRTGFEKYKLPVEQAEYKKAQSDIYAPYVGPHFVRESGLGKYAGGLGSILGSYAGAGGTFGF